ncbi:MAG: DCC1-like thiol-disulfide oxidoreductase family protein [Pseudomonadota bacterium]
MVAPTYVYDGECVLCSRAVQYVIKHDRGEPPIRFVAIKSAEGRSIAAEAGVDPDDPSTFLFVEDETIYGASDALFAMARHLSGPAHWFRFLRFIPRGLRDWFYSRIANNRYALFGKLDRCYLPDAKDRHRFVLE